VLSLAGRARAAALTLDQVLARPACEG